MARTPVPVRVPMLFGSLALLFIGALALLAVPTAGAQRSANATRLEDLSRRFRSDLIAKRTPLYQQLLASTDPLQLAQNRDPNLKLMFVRENGHPAYYLMNNENAARTVRTWDVWPVGVGGGVYALTGSATAGGELGIWDGGGVFISHVEFGGRVSQMDVPLAIIQHATHVAGTMVAAGSNTAARGMSYEALLHAYDWDFDLSEMANAAANGMQVSNHSYGYAGGWEGSTWYGDLTVSVAEDYGFGFYDASARDTDVVAYNAPHYLIVIAAGNDRNDNWGGSHTHFVGGFPVMSNDVHGADFQNGGYDTITWTGNAKNPLLVGAVNDIPAGYVDPTSVVQTAFSSWGPTDDGRIKPDIVTNGSAVTSTNNIAGGYATLSGTSMASPSASGSVNLIVHEFENQYGRVPRSSTIKALVINSADEAGPADGPDYSNGWGLLNTRRAIEMLNAHGHEAVGLFERTMNAGEVHTYYFTVDAPQDVRLTIAWTDPAGVSPAPSLDPTNVMLVNDLDVRITHLASGTITSPWRLDALNPAVAATQADNDRDNVESIDIDNAPAGAYEVTVSHKNVLTNGVQDYGMVWRGMRASQAPELTAGSHTAIDLAGGDPSLQFHGSDRNQARSVFITAVQDVAVSAIAMKIAFPWPTSLKAEIFEANGTTRGALVANGALLTQYPGEVFHYVNVSAFLQACHEYEIAFGYQETVSWPAWFEPGGIPPTIVEPFDIGGAIRVRDGAFNGAALIPELTHIAIKGTVLPPLSTQLEPVPLLPWAQISMPGAGVTGMYVRADRTFTLDRIGVYAGFPPATFVSLRARVYLAAALTRGPLLAEGHSQLVTGVGVAHHSIPMNLVLEEGLEYDIEVEYPAGTDLEYIDESGVTPFLAAPLHVLDAESGSSPATTTLPHFELGWTEYAGGAPHNLAKHNDTPQPSMVAPGGGGSYGLYTTALINQELYSLGWSADVPAGETIIMRVYESIGLARGALLSEGQILSDGSGTRWHDVPVAVSLTAGAQYDFEVEFFNAGPFGFWDDALGLPYTAYGLVQVDDAEQGGNPGATELVHMRMNACNTTATAVGPGATPTFSLSAPYPNPVHAGATIDFTLDRDESVSIQVYDVAGRRVATLMENASRVSGAGSVALDARGLVSGVYFVRLETPTRSVSRKITIVK